MAGRATPGIKIRIVDADSRPLPHDGQSRGELRVKGPWIAASYLNRPTGSALDADGWLDTGDIATIDPTAISGSSIAPRISSNPAASGSVRSRSRPRR